MTTNASISTTSTAQPGTAGQRVFAGWYPWMMARVERSGQAEYRRAQLAQAEGRTLEIGAGDGLSVPHYTSRVTELTLVEPNPHLRDLLAVTARAAAPAKVEVTDGDAHALPYSDSTFDTVTASLVFCSVTDPATALSEVHRVLKPGGRFLFHEHVRGHGVRAFIQDLLNPLQRRLADGCHANRDFQGLLDRSPFELDELEHLRMPTWIPTIVPLVVGAARRVV